MKRAAWNAAGRRLVPAFLVLLALALPAALSAAVAAAVPLQLPGETLARQSLRPYAHVFVAYAIAWLLVVAWTWSIAKRLARVERRLRGEG